MFKRGQLKVTSMVMTTAALIALGVPTFNLLAAKRIDQGFDRGSVRIIPRAERVELDNTLDALRVVSKAADQDKSSCVTDFTAPHVVGEVLVTFNEWASKILRDDALQAIGARDMTSFRQDGYANRVTLDIEALQRIREARQPRAPRELDRNATITRQGGELSFALGLLNEHPAVACAELNYMAHALSTPNDPYYKLQWNFSLLGLATAWDQARGSGVTVAVIDTGVAYEKWSRYRQASDLDQTAFVEGYNFVNRSRHANDDNGHGTHVAGTIAGSTNNNEGVAGIAYEAAIMPIKVLDRAGAGTYADIADGIRLAADNGADVINLSLGGPVPSQIMEAAVAYAAEKGVLVVAAAGNDGQGQLLYPAAYDEYVLAVGAVRADRTRSPYSTYGTSLDLVAPGGDTAVDQTGDGYPDGILQQTLKQGAFRANTRKFNYYFYQGTSMAAPHVAGAAALVKSLGVSGLAELRQILLDSAEDLESQGWDQQTGYGLVRADKAVELALKTIDNSQLTSDQEESDSSSSSGASSSSSQLNNSNLPDNPEQPKRPNSPNDNSPTEEESPAEEEPAQEPELGRLNLEMATYNMFGRVDSAFRFWESATLGIQITNVAEKPLAGADLRIEVVDDVGQRMARGDFKSDARGELWIKLGTYTKGSYEIIVRAGQEGYETVESRASFRFR